MILIKQFVTENENIIFSSSPPFIKQSNYYYEGGGYTFKNTCEKATHIYYIAYQYDYPKRLQQWKKSSNIKIR
nr:hypothetical protein ['Planchonia careya' phytoplasma]